MWDSSLSSLASDDVSVHVPCTLCTPCGLGCKDCIVVKLEDTRPVCDVVFGVPWDPIEFINTVCTIGHPQNIVLGLSVEVKEATEKISMLSPDQVVMIRGRWLGKYGAAARELKSNNDEILSTMPPEMRAVTKSKRLALMEEMLHDEAYPERTLVDDMAAGFSLVGEAPTLHGILPQKFTPASIHVDELSAGAALARDACRRTTRTSGCHETDMALWSKTLEERDKGWLVGPTDWDSLEPTSVVSKRFPLHQGSKLRPIDDYSTSSVNATVGTLEQATTDNIDVISSMLAELMKQLSSRGRCTKLLARSFDLCAAYRQLCVAPSSYTCSHISVYDPVSCEPRVFRQVCLPFGFRSAANACIRCAKCIQWLAAKCFFLPTTCYLSTSLWRAHQSLLLTMSLATHFYWTCWDGSMTRRGPKPILLAIGRPVVTLGVQFDLHQTIQGCFNVCNTAKRISDALGLIDATLKGGVLSKKNAQVLRGRLGFAYWQIFGLSGKMALQRISEHAFRGIFSANISQQLSDSLVFLRNRRDEGLPRKVLKAGQRICYPFGCEL